MTATITYKNGWVFDCESTTGWTETETGVSATLTTDGDAFTITGTPSTAGSDYAYYEYDLPDFISTLYSTCIVRFKTSGASNGLEPVISFITSGAAEVNKTYLGFSTQWKTTTITLTGGNTLSKIRLYADDNPDSLAAGSTSVYFDFVLVCKGTFTFPHVAPGEVRVNYGMIIAQLKVPGRHGDILQSLGQHTPEIILGGDVLEGEAWRLNTSVPHFDYLLRALLIDSWNWFTCDFPAVKAQVKIKDLSTYVDVAGNNAKLKWTLTLLLHKLSSYSGWPDYEWMYSA